MMRGWSVVLMLALGCSSEASRPAIVEPGGPGGAGGAAGAPGGGAGGAAVCSAGVVRCSGQARQVCDGKGGFLEEEECAMGCVPGRGCVVCQPGEASCGADGVSTYCKEDGTGYEQEPCDPEMGLSCGALGRCEGACSRQELKRSYIGCEYWPVVTPNSGLFDGFAFAVAVSNTGESGANIRISRGTKVLESAQLAPGAVRVFKLPWVAALKDIDVLDGAYESGVVKGGAYRVRSDQPITVYQFNPLDFEIEDPGGCPPQPGLTPPGKCNSFTNDASLLLPTNSLSYEYIVASRPTRPASGKQPGGGAWRSYTPGFFSVVATEDSTTVRVIARGFLKKGAAIEAMAPGDVRSVTLDRGDVLQVFSAAPSDAEATGCKSYSFNDGSSVTVCSAPLAYDPSGTVVQSDKRVQVVAGHDCAFVPGDRFACDHLEESIFPVDTWGDEVLVTAPQSVKGAASATGAADQHLVRVISGADGNEISLDPPLSPGRVLDRGEYVDVPLTDRDFVVKGTRALLVAQYMLGGDVVDPENSGKPQSKGDPSMSLGIPSVQYRGAYSFLAPASYTYSFVNVVAPDGVAVTLDGQPLGGDAVPIGGSGFGVRRVPIEGGAHTISAPEPFGIVVYGYGNYTSYMYPGGLDLKQVDVDIK